MHAKSLVSPILSGLLATSLAVSAGCVGWQPARFQASREASIAAMGDSMLDVETANGHVYVTQQNDQSSVDVDAVLKLRTQERADAVEIVAEYQPDGTLEVRVLWPDGKRLGNESCSFDVTLPAAAGVMVRTSNGAIRLTGLAGTADLSTSNGRVSVIGFDGDVVAHSSNGRIEVDGAAGSVDANTSNGRVIVSLTDDATGPVTIRSSNGAIEFNTGDAFEGYVSASTSNGSIHVEGSGIDNLKTSRRHASFSVGEGGSQSDLSTSNGSVTIRINGG